MRSDCPSEAELLAFLRGTVVQHKIDRLAKHIEECCHCELVAQRVDAEASHADPLLITLRLFATDPRKGVTKRSEHDLDHPR